MLVDKLEAMDMESHSPFGFDVLSDNLYIKPYKDCRYKGFQSPFGSDVLWDNFDIDIQFCTKLPKSQSPFGSGVILDVFQFLPCLLQVGVALAFRLCCPFGQKSMASFNKVIVIGSQSPFGSDVLSYLCANIISTAIRNGCLNRLSALMSFRTNRDCSHCIFADFD